MKISMLIHNLNRAAILSNCLSSVAKQSFRPLEVIILDAGSTDLSLDVIDRASHRMEEIGIEVRSIICPPMGVAASRNFAAKKSSGELLCAIDNDACFVRSDSLERTAEYFHSYPRLAIVSFRILKENTDEIDPFTWVYRRPKETWGKRTFNTFTFAGGGFCVRSTAFWEVEGFWDQLQFSREEEDLGLALINKGWKLVYTPEIEVRHYPENCGRYSNSKRRFMELQNGILIFWRRFPKPLAIIAICIRICTMSSKMFWREKKLPTELLRAVPEAIRKWRALGMQRLPITFASVWKYFALHFRT
jgi:GT2 family glycosyltransferase